MGPAIKQKYRSPGDTWDKRRSVGKSPSFSRRSPDLLQSPSLPRSKSQHIPRDASKGRIVLKPPLPSQSLSWEVIDRIHREKCNDMSILSNPEQMSRFAEFCARNVGRRKFAMEDCGLGPSAASAIAEVIRGTSEFAFLYLGRNPLKDDGVCSLAKAVSKSSHIVHLGVNNTDLSPEGSSELCSLLSSHASLTSLDLSSADGLYRNRLGKPGASSLSSLLRSSVVVTVLNVSGTALGLDGAETLSVGLHSHPSLIWLDISANHLSGKAWDKLGKALSSTKLQYVNISENKLGAIGAECLGKMLAGVYGLCPIATLIMAKCDINATCARAILAGMAKNPNVKSLSLEQNQFGSEELTELFQFLLENNSVQQLNLSECRLRGDGIAGLADGLARNRAITGLNLAGNLFEDAGAVELADAIAKNDALTYLDLSSNRIRQTGGTAICQSLQHNRTLEVVILRDNGIDDAGGKILSEISYRNRSLTKVGLEYNHVNMRFVREIERNMSANRLRKQRSVTPLLRSEVSALRLPRSAFDDINKDKEAKVREQKALEGQLETQRERLSHVAEEESEKMDALREELEAARLTKLQKAAGLRELQMQIKARTTQAEAEQFASTYPELESAFFDLAAEVKRLEKERKR